MHHGQPLYDEGLNKLLFAVELAVRLRCQQLGLPARQSWQERSAYLCAREPQKGQLLGTRLGRKIRRAIHLFSLPAD